MNKNILVTGAAGFIGMHLCSFLAAKGYKVLGMDNLNDYYDPQLKKDRLAAMGVPEISDKSPTASSQLPLFSFLRSDILDAGQHRRIGVPICCYKKEQ